MDDYLRAKLIKEFDMNFEDALTGLKKEIQMSGGIFLMSRKLVQKAALLCSALLILGCNLNMTRNATKPVTETNGSTVSTEQASAAIDPCSLVTKEEVGKVIEEAVLETEARGDTCTYQTEDATASSVEIEVKRKDGAAKMQSARKAMKILGNMGEAMKSGDNGAVGGAGELLSEEDSSAVSGIGDEAFFGTSQQLFVLKNNTYFTVRPPIMRSRTGSMNPLLKAEEKRAMAKLIAQKVAAKL
jgi:hypothetical protein